MHILPGAAGLGHGGGRHDDLPEGEGAHVKGLLHPPPGPRLDLPPESGEGPHRPREVHCSE